AILLAHFFALDTPTGGVLDFGGKSMCLTSPDPGFLRAHLRQTEGREPLELPDGASVWREGGGGGRSSGRAVAETPEEALTAEAAQTGGTDVAAAPTQTSSESAFRTGTADRERLP